MATGDKAELLWSVAFNAPWCGEFNRKQLMCEVELDGEMYRIAFKTPGHCTTTLPPHLMPDGVHDVCARAHHTTFYTHPEAFNETIHTWLWKLYAAHPNASVMLR